MLKIDVNKSGKIFDFLVSAGILRLSYDPSAKGIGPGKEGHVIHGNVNGYGQGHGSNGVGEGTGHGRPGLAEVHIPNGTNGSR